MIATIAPSEFIQADGTQTNLDAAMFDAVSAFAREAGLPCLTMADVIAASRQPVSYAAVFADLCAALGVESPAWVCQALS